VSEVALPCVADDVVNVLVKLAPVAASVALDSSLALVELSSEKQPPSVAAVAHIHSARRPIALQRRQAMATCSHDRAGPGQRTAPAAALEVCEGATIGAWRSAARISIA